MNSREAFELTGAGGEWSYQIDCDDPSVAYAWGIWHAATAAERERCAAICDEISNRYWTEYKDSADKSTRYNPYTEGVSDGAEMCADAIRKEA